MGRKIWVRKAKEEWWRAAELTDVSWCATSSGHDVSGALHLRETEVADHDLWLVLGIKIQQILWLNTKKRGWITEFHPEQQIKYIKKKQTLKNHKMTFSPSLFIHTVLVYERLLDQHPPSNTQPAQLWHKNTTHVSKRGYYCTKS